MITLDSNKEQEKKEETQEIKPEEETAQKLTDKPEIVITLENGFTGAIGFQLKQIPSAAIARFMMDEAKEHILAYIYQKKMEKEAVRRNLAGGKGFIPATKDFLFGGKKH